MRFLKSALIFSLVGCDSGSGARPAMMPHDSTTEARSFAAATADDGLTKSDTTRENGFTIVTISQGIVDTVWDIVSVDTIERPVPPEELGVPLGSAALDQEGTVPPQTWGQFSTGTPSALYKNLQFAARHKLKAISLNLPGGQHSSVGPNLSMIGGKLRYDSTKYKARVLAFDQKPVRDSLAKYCLPTGKIKCEINNIDEPHVHGGDDGAGTVQKNTWGEKGWMTKAKVDRQCQLIKSVIPHLAVGPAGAPTLFEPTGPAYKHCDYIRAQYSWRMSATGPKANRISLPGAREKWWNDQVTAAKGLPVAPSINIINGGIQDTDGTYDCKTQGGLVGQRQPNCAMMPDSALVYLLYFGTIGSGSQMMWRQDALYTKRLEPTIKKAGDSLAKVPYKVIPRR